MISKSAFQSILYRWKERVVTGFNEWVAQSHACRGARRLHFWIIAIVIALGALNYYVGQTPLVKVPPFNALLFTGIHDLHRIMFFIPVIYAAVVFRVRGSLIASLAFLGIILPRAMLFSPYPNALIRPLLSVIFAMLISLFLATRLNGLEKEKKSRQELAVAYKELAKSQRQLEETQEELIQAEKLSALGQLAASIAHEINNPISGVLVYAQLLAKKIKSDKFSKEAALEYLSKMEAELTRSSRLVRSLLDFARQSPPTLKETDINDVLKRALDLAARSAQLQYVEVMKELDSSLPKVMADSSQIQQVFTNLIANAIEAMPDGGKLTLRSSISDSQVRIEVQDTGCGICSENMRKLFTPFFTTKSEVKGVGLGLAVAHGIIQRHRGKIEVQSKEGEGAIFTIYLPVVAKTSSDS